MTMKAAGKAAAEGPKDSHVRIHRLWLTFDDPEMEQNYISSWRQAVRRTARIWAACAFVFYILMTVVLYRLDADHTLDDQWFRLYVCIPLLLLEFVLACLPRPNIRLSDSMYLIAGLACFGNAAISHGIAPEQLQFFYLLELSVTFVFCGSYFRASYLQVVIFVAIAVVFATPIVLYVHISDQTDLGRMAAEMTIITGLSATVLLTAYHHEILARRNFRDIRVATAEEAAAQELARLALADSDARSHFLSIVGSEFQLTIDQVTRVSDVPKGEDDRLDGYMADIHNSALRLQKTVHQIMDAASQAESRQPAQFDNVQLDREAEAAIERNRFDFANSIMPTYSAGNVELPPVFADPVDVRNILDELFSNAAKHGKGDEPVVCQTIQVSRSTLQFRIMNGSPALDRQEIDRVFKPFIQLDDGLARTNEGLGLGLPRARRLAESNGGRLYLESGSNGGITAILELPIAHRDAVSQDRLALLP